MKNNEVIQIDGIDKILLNELMKNARISINHLSKQVGISGAAVHQRLKKLEKSGLIRGSQLTINPKKN